MTDKKEKAIDLRNRIKKCIKFMNMTYKEAASIISGDYEDQLEDGLIYSSELYICTEETLKKDLQRSNNVDKLDSYLSILRKSEKFKVLNERRDNIDSLTDKEREDIRKIAQMIKNQFSNS